MVGWLPGGSAGTSFCSGTEMSISLRAMRGLPFLRCWWSASGVLTLDLVLQHADLLDFELDGVAVFEKLAELQPAAVADGAGADEFARHQGLVPGDVFNDFLE